MSVGWLVGWSHIVYWFYRWLESKGTRSPMIDHLNCCSELPESKDSNASGVHKGLNALFPDTKKYSYKAMLVSSKLCEFIRIITLLWWWCKNVNQGKYSEKSISVRICQPFPPIHSAETGQALARWDLRPVSAITWTQLATWEEVSCELWRLESGARQKVIRERQ